MFEGGIRIEPIKQVPALAANQKVETTYQLALAQTRSNTRHDTTHDTTHDTMK